MLVRILVSKSVSLFLYITKRLVLYGRYGRLPISVASENQLQVSEKAICPRESLMLSTYGSWFVQEKLWSSEFLQNRQVPIFRRSLFSSNAPNFRWSIEALKSAFPPKRWSPAPTFQWGSDFSMRLRFSDEVPIFYEAPIFRWDFRWSALCHWAPKFKINEKLNVKAWIFTKCLPPWSLFWIDMRVLRIYIKCQPWSLFWESLW